MRNPPRCALLRHRPTHTTRMLKARCGVVLCSMSLNGSPLATKVPTCAPPADRKRRNHREVPSTRDDVMTINNMILQRGTAMNCGQRPHIISKSPPPHHQLRAVQIADSRPPRPPSDILICLRQGASPRNAGDDGYMGRRCWSAIRLADKYRRGTPHNFRLGAHGRLGRSRRRRNWGL